MIVFPFVCFLLAITLSVLLRVTVSDYSFGIFKRFFLALKWLATFIVFDHQLTVLIKQETKGKRWYTQNIEFLIGGKIVKKIIGMSMGTNCVPLLSDHFLLSLHYLYTSPRFHQSHRYNQDILYTCHIYVYIESQLDISLFLPCILCLWYK